MSVAVEPSVSNVIFEHEEYLSFPAIASAGGRLIVIFRMAKGNPLDFNAKILITYSDDGGQSWSDPETWIDEPGVDSRNCGGGTLRDGTAHFVYDMHGGEGAWRRTFFRTSSDGIHWSAPVRLMADLPEGPKEQITAVGNRAIEWDSDTLYFPHFKGASVLANRKDGTQRQIETIPRIETTVAWNRRGELVAFSKGGPVDISPDRGKTWYAVAQLSTISQPDLVQLSDGRLLFCYSGKCREDEYLLLSEDGHNVQNEKETKIFKGTPDGRIDSRGKAQALEYGEYVVTVLYEACGPRGKSRIYLVKTPKAALE